MLVELLAHFAAWSGFYFSLSFTYAHRSAEWISRVAALTHSLVACFCIERCIWNTPDIVHRLGYANTSAENVAVLISGGYFAFEVAWCLYMRTEGMLMLCHHLISLASLIGCAYFQVSGAEVVLTTWGAELTNPFLQVRWFLLESGRSDTIFAYFNDTVFVLMFFVARICLGTILMVHMHYATKPNIIFKIGGYTFYAIGLIWSYQIFCFALKRFKKFSRRKIS